MLDTALEAIFVSFVIQGLKQLDLWKDEYGKVIAVAVAALFFFANGLIALAPKELQGVIKQVVDLVKAVLSAAAVAGVYGYAKLLAPAAKK